MTSTTSSTSEVSGLDPVLRAAARVVGKAEYLLSTESSYDDRVRLVHLAVVIDELRQAMGLPEPTCTSAYGPADHPVRQRLLSGGMR